MMRDERLQQWRELVGDSDDGEDDFEGFVLEEIGKGEESDIDLDVLVQADRLFDSDSFSEESENESRDDDKRLPEVVPPSKKRRRASKERDTITTHFSDRVRQIHEKVTKTFEDNVKEGKVLVGVTHGLPKEATPYNYFSLYLRESVGGHGRAEADRETS